MLQRWRRSGSVAGSSGDRYRNGAAGSCAGRRAADVVGLAEAGTAAAVGWRDDALCVGGSGGFVSDAGAARRFEEAVAAVAEAGLRPAWVHAGSSSTWLITRMRRRIWRGCVRWRRVLGRRPMVRSGIALYGYCLPIEPEAAAVEAKVRTGLQPVMSWKTRVIGVREVKAGETVGYNATFTAERPMRLALLPVGYADGLRRELSGSNAAAGRLDDGSGAAGGDCGSRVDEPDGCGCDGDSRASRLAMRWLCWAMA